MESRLLASQFQSGNSRVILKQQHTNVIATQDATLIGNNSKYIANDSFKNSVTFQPINNSLAYSINNSVYQKSVVVQPRQPYESRLQTPGFPTSLKNSCYTTLQSSVGPQTRSRLPKWPEEQLVVVNNLTFIAYREQSRSISKEKTKIINLKSRSKQKKSIIIKQASKSLISQREIIVKQNISPNLNIVASPSPIILRQATPQKIIQNMDQQSLLRKLRILQNRVTELHTDKQKYQIKLQQATTQFAQQLNDKNFKIANLEEKLMRLCSKYEDKEKESLQLQQRLWRQKQQIQKLKQELASKSKVQISPTTQNFINLTLSQEIESLSNQNSELKKEIQQLNTKNLELRNASLNKRWQNIINQPEQIDLPIIQDDHQGQVTHVVPINWVKFLQQSSRSMGQSQRTFEISRDQIMPVDSQHMQVDQIINNIHNISSQNEQLKLELHEKINQLQVKDMVTMQTARIIQQIKDAVRQLSLDGQSSGAQGDLEKTKKWVNFIKEILSQFQ